MIVRSTDITLVPLKQIKLNPRNRNNHSKEQIDWIIKLIQYQGFRSPGTISNQSGFLACGEGRYLALKKMGESEMPCMYQDFDSPDQEYAHGVADNAITIQAALDLKSIGEDITDFGPDFDLELLGIKDFVLEPADKGGLCGDDEVPEPPKEAKTKRGELWLLGEHRFLINDCTVKENVERLMNGEKADMVYSDPPYGFGYNPDLKNHPMRDGSMRNKNNHRPLQNDMGDWNFDVSHIFKQFGYCEEIFLWGADYYHLHLPKIGGWIVWDKTGAHPNMDKSYLASFELCWSKQTHKRHMIPLTWMGCFGHTPEDGDRKVHPTQKPIKLGQFFFEKWSQPGHIIVDHYLGSGSSLIACQKTNRRCFGMEIDPLYGDVILDRFHKYSGIEPVREDGVKWSELQ